MNVWKCICCLKEVRTGEYADLPVDGGMVEVHFGYGSRHDQGSAGLYEAATRLDKLLASHRILGAICDDCFESRQGLFEGFDVEEKSVLVRTTLPDSQPVKE